MRFLRKTRRGLYKGGRILGDIDALLSGRIASRMANKLIGRHGVRRTWVRGGCTLPVLSVMLIALAAVLTAPS